MHTKGTVVTSAILSLSLALSLGACTGTQEAEQEATHETTTQEAETPATKYDVYIAGPGFNDEELANLEYVEGILEEKGLTYFSPMRHTVDEPVGSEAWAEKIFDIDVEGADESAMMVVLYYGNYSDSGTAFEQGSFYQAGKPIVVVHMSRDESANLMITNGATTNIYLDELADYDFDKMEVRHFEGSLT